MRCNGVVVVVYFWAVVTFASIVSSGEQLESLVADIDDRVRVIINRLYRHEARSRMSDEIVADGMRSLLDRWSGHTTAIESMTVHLANMHERLNSLEQHAAANSDKLDEMLSLLRTSSQTTSASSSQQSEQNLKIDSDVVEYLRNDSAVVRALAHTNLAVSSQILDNMTSSLDNITALLLSSAENMHSTRQGVRSNGNIIGKLRTTEDIMDLSRFPSCTEANLRQSLSTILSGVNNSVSLKLNHLSEKLEDLMSVVSVVHKTGEHVLSLRRSVEFATARLTGTITAASSNQAANMSQTIDAAMKSVVTKLNDSQTNALHNLTTQLEEEIGQVWRQIGVVYSRLDTSGELLQNIDIRTTQYVNESQRRSEQFGVSLTALSRRVDELHADMNYALGRLSLVSSEFRVVQKAVAKQLATLNSSSSPGGGVDGGGLPIASGNFSRASEAVDQVVDEGRRVNVRLDGIDPVNEAV